MDWFTPLIIVINGLCQAPDPCLKVPGVNAPEEPKPAIVQPAEEPPRCKEVMIPEKGLTLVCEEKK